MTTANAHPLPAAPRWSAGLRPNALAQGAATLSTITAVGSSAASVPLWLCLAFSLPAALVALSVVLEPVELPTTWHGWRWRAACGGLVVNTLIAVHALSRLTPYLSTLSVLLIPAVITTWAVTSRRWSRRASTAQTLAEQRAARVAQESERRRWARDLHDETLQQLAALKLLVTTAELAPDLPSARTSLLGARGLIEEQFGSLTYLISAGRPAILDRVGLVAAIEVLARKVEAAHPIRVTVTANVPSARARPEAAAAEIDEVVYRVAQEAITNAVKHARPSSIRVTIEERHEVITLRVSDDGIGFSRPATIAGEGLSSMEERAFGVGGRLSVSSRPGLGTTVTLTTAAPRLLQAGHRARGDDPREPLPDTPGRAAPPEGDSHALTVGRYLRIGRWAAAVVIPIQFTVSYVIQDQVASAPFMSAALSLAIIVLNLLQLRWSAGGTEPTLRQNIACVAVDGLITLTVIAYLQFDDSSSAWIGLIIVTVEACFLLPRLVMYLYTGALLLAYAAIVAVAAAHFDRPLSWAQLTLIVTLLSVSVAASLAIQSSSRTAGQ